MHMHMLTCRMCMYPQLRASHNQPQYSIAHNHLDARARRPNGVCSQTRDSECSCPIKSRAARVLLHFTPSGVCLYKSGPNSCSCCVRSAMAAAETEVAMESVLPIEATRPLELMECSAAWVRPQQVSSLVKTLAAEMRQPALNHLKRVCRQPPPPGSEAAGREGPSIGVLLWLGGPGELGALPASMQEVLRAFELAPLTVSVPRHSPMTREQFAAWNEHWPLTYHESAVQHALRCSPAAPPRVPSTPLRRAHHCAVQPSSRPAVQPSSPGRLSLLAAHGHRRRPPWSVQSWRATCARPSSWRGRRTHRAGGVRWRQSSSSPTAERASQARRSCRCAEEPSTQPQPAGSNTQPPQHPAAPNAPPPQTLRHHAARQACRRDVRTGRRCLICTHGA